MGGDASRASRGEPVERRGRDRCRVWVRWIGSGNRVQQQGQIPDAAGDRAGMIEAGSHGDNSRETDASVRWLAPGNAAIRGGTGDRTARLRADGAQAHACRDGGRRSARRSAGGAIDVPRISGGGRIEAGELRRHGLAQQNGAGLAQFPHNRRIGASHSRGHPLRAGAGGKARHVDDVLDAERDAMQRSTPAAGAALLVELVCAEPGAVTIDRDPRVNTGLPFVDAGETTVDEGPARNLPSPERLGRAGNRFQFVRNKAHDKALRGGPSHTLQRYAARAGRLACARFLERGTRPAGVLRSRDRMASWQFAARNARPIGRGV